MFTHTELVHEMQVLKKFARKLTKQESDADDLMQSTLLKALEKNHLFQDDTNLCRWTSKIMYNLFVSGYRRKTKFETQYDPESYLLTCGQKETQESEIEFQEVCKAMQHLSDEHYEILMLICVRGMQYAEVSEYLQIPVGTVRSRLFRARESLQMLLESPKSSIATGPSFPVPSRETMRLAA